MALLNSYRKWLGLKGEASPGSGPPIENGYPTVPLRVLELSIALKIADVYPHVQLLIYDLRAYVCFGNEICISDRDRA